MTPTVTRFLLLLVLPFCSCQSVDRLLDNREYERAYTVALQRVTDRRRPSPKHVDQLLLAFDHLQLDRMLRIETLEGSRAPDRWLELHRLYVRAYNRSVDVLDAVGPAAIEHAATPKPAELEARREEARYEAGYYLQRRAEVLLPFARAGGKEDARSAHGYYRSALRYRPEMKDAFEPLLAETKELGTVRVLLQTPSPTPLHEDFLLPLANRPPVRQEWFELVYNFSDDRVDVVATVELNDYSVNGPRERSSRQSHCEEVLDYIEKKKTRVKVNDSTYVDKVEEIKHYKTVTAESTTYTQRMSVEWAGLLRTRLATGTPTATSWPLAASARWSHSYVVCSGDSDAFPSDCGGSRRSPPDEFTLLSEAARSIYPRAEQILRCNYGECPPPRKRRRWRARRQSGS